jgi:chemosensory pili system protein ChpA (sensor histidine kinase/response regulator)
MKHVATDYNALSWVRQEIEATLCQAGAVLVEFCGDTKRVELLHEYSELLHQVRGPLQIAELLGAELLVSEMESVAADLRNGSVNRPETLLDILLQTMQILQGYLSRLQSSSDDTPEAVLPQVNMLRSARSVNNSEAMEATGLQQITLPEGVYHNRERGNATAITARVHSARVQFQSALLAWYRGGAGDKAFAALIDVLEQLQDDAGSESEACLWWIASGIVDALSTGLLPDSKEIKQIFGRLDRQIKRLGENIDEDFCDAPTQALLSDLLNLIPDIEVCDGRLAEILTTFRHGRPDMEPDAGSGTVTSDGMQRSQQQIPDINPEASPGYVAYNFASNSSSECGTDFGMHEDIINPVSTVEFAADFQEMLRGISLVKEAIEGFLNAPGNEDPLSPVSVILNGVCGKLHSAGLGREAAIITSAQEFIISEMLESRQTPDEGMLLHLADAICSIEFYLECLRDGRIFGSRMLELAEDHVAALGFPVCGQECHASKPSSYPGKPDANIDDENEAVKDCNSELAVSVLQVIDPEPDKEILEIFLDECSAGLNVLRELVPVLEKGNDHKDELEEISRVFHTLKGNGRMLGAHVLGEFAYVFESLVNNASSGSVHVDTEFTCLLKQACEALPQLVAQVEDSACQPSMDIEALESEAVRICQSDSAGASGLSGDIHKLGVTPCTGVVNPTCKFETGLPFLDVDADPEIVEILLEEADKEITVLAEAIPSWKASPDNLEILAEIRRVMHTLKGSGRMAGALLMGEYSWVMENLLNRVMEGLFVPDDAMFSLLERVPSALQQLSDQIRDGSQPAIDIEALMTEVANLRNTTHENAVTHESVPDVAEDTHMSESTLQSHTGQSNKAGEPPSDTDDALLQIYTRESQDIIETIRSYLDNYPECDVVTESLYRGLHTLAGISESAEVGRIGNLASDLDRYFSCLYHKRDRVPPAAFGLLNESCDVLAHMIESMPEVSSRAPEMIDLCNRIASLYVAEESVERGASTTSKPLYRPYDSRDSSPVERAESEGPGSEEYFGNVDQELLEIFVEEATEIMEACEKVLHVWVSEPEDHDSLVEYQRHLHTVKGSARMMDFTAIGDLCHSMETVLSRVAEDTLEPHADLFAALFAAQDKLAEMLDQIGKRHIPVACPDMEAVLEQLLHIPSAEACVPDKPETVAMSGPENEADLGIEENSESPAVIKSSDCNIRDCADINRAPLLRAEPETAESAEVETAGNISVERSPVYLESDHQSDQSEPLKELGHDIDSGIADGETGILAKDPVVSQQHSEAIRHKRKQDQERKRSELVKVQSGLLDDLVNYSGEINIYNTRIETQIGDYRFNLGELEQTIERLRGQLRKLEMDIEAQVLYRYSQEVEGNNQDFDPLELDRYSMLQESSRSLMETISDLYNLSSSMEKTTRDSETLLLQESRISSDLHEGLMHMRMTPFAGLETRLKRVVRQSARHLEKRVELVFRGAEGEMDRAVIERMIAPLEHILRNAVAHGIESPAERINKGKGETGNITITFDREGPDVVLQISDDGTGMNLEAIRKKAAEKGLLDPHVEISDSEATQFILQTGFTTASEVTQISGRGVGLDVVNSEVKQLGGALNIESVWGSGTVFTIRLPYTLATNQALLVKAGADTYCVPLGNVEGVVRAHPETLLACYAESDPVYDYAGNQYQLKHLASLLNTGHLDAGQMPVRVPLLLMRIGDNRIALHVDSLTGSREIVVKPVGMQLNSIEGITGATILGDGSIGLILDVFALSRGHACEKQPEMKLVSGDEKRLVVMVVDDSITVRKVTTRLLERNGYKVLTAKDGVDATGQLQNCTPDIMLLDIEMPRMDGFELATHIRNDERLRHVPLVMITSRTGDKHRERAQQIGINYYLGKPYQETDLLATIDQIIRVAPGSTAKSYAGVQGG